MKSQIFRFTFALLPLFLSTLSGCSHVDYVRDAIRLPDAEIAAPAGSMQLFAPRSNENTTVHLERVTKDGVKVLLDSLEHPLSLTADVSVSTLTSLNPEIISKNRFGSVAASGIAKAMAEEGFTVNHKGPSDSAPQERVSISGTYSQAGGTLSLRLQLTNSADKKVLASREFTLPIDGALRQLLDK